MSINGKFVKNSIYLDGDLKINIMVEGNTSRHKVNTKINLKNPHADVEKVIEALQTVKGDIDYMTEKLPHPDMSKEEANVLADSVEEQKSKELNSKEVLIDG